MAAAGSPEGYATAEPHEEDIGLGDDEGGGAETSQLMDLRIPEQGDIGQVPGIGVDEVDLHVVADHQVSTIEEQVVHKQCIGDPRGRSRRRQFERRIVQNQFAHGKVIHKSGNCSAHILDPGGQGII